MDLRCQVELHQPGGFPRRRGDGPSAGSPAAWGGAFPPQARGWTAGAGQEARAQMVSPAGAGMDPDACDDDGRPPGFPRRRGDGPKTATNAAKAVKFPPQARGWTGPIALLAGLLPVSPAGAGMDHPPPLRLLPRKRFPRRRGDGPCNKVVGARGSRFPPQARGWTRGLAKLGVRGCVSPAGAGMDLARRPARMARAGFPRRRGDGPWRMPPTPSSTAFPPQARGWTAWHRRLPPPDAVSPAGAGMDLPAPGR